MPNEETTKSASPAKPKIDVTGSKTQSAPSTERKKPWYKQKKNWYIAAFVVTAIISLGFFLFYRNNSTKTKHAIQDGWHTIVLQAQIIITTADRVQSTTSADDLQKELTTLDTIIKDQTYKAEKLPSFLTASADRKLWQQFLKDYGAYIKKSSENAAEIADFNTDKYDDLQNLAETAKSKTTTMKNDGPNLNEDMPDVFDLYNTLDTIRSNVNEKETEEKTAKDKLAATVAQDAVDKATVEKNVTTFEVAFIAADANKMKPVMSTGFIGEYDFSQITVDYRKYSYPESFRIIETKKEGTTYTVKVNTVYKNRDDSGNITGQYTVGSTFTIPSGGGKWLINSEKRDSAY